ncbi:MAG: hypothetical protein M1829_004359 [Trizodia sp. TS-e1964]|nr:MAG: hypothetical protein M1829_004359 [Trizodia sp. TS-e1964]
MLLGTAALAPPLLYLALLARQQPLTAAEPLAPASQPPSRPFSATPAHVRDGRQPRGGLVEALKDRWNDEVEGGVRWAQRVDWAGVGDEVVDVVVRIWRRSISAARGGEL